MAKTVGFFDDSVMDGLKMNRGYDVPKMRVLIACEFSGLIRNAFLEKGHDAMSCDLVDSELPGPHYKGDVRDILYDDWDMMIAMPTSTYLSNSGASIFQKDDKHWADIDAAIEFFLLLKNAPIKKICIENPVMCPYAKNKIGQQTQIIHPWLFGHKEQRMTCLWLNGLHRIVPVKNVKAEMMLLPEKERIPSMYLSPSPNRWKERCRSYTGIAAAMADQWG
jgi:hypothetical protein